MRTLLPAAASVALAVGLLLGVGMAVPTTAFACSCIAPQPIGEYANEGNVILAGAVLGEDDGGIRMGVEQWFSGDQPTPVVRIASDFGNGASCGIGFVPPEGSSWIGVLWRPEGDDPLAELEANENLQVSICQPFVDLDTPEGQDLFDEAMATFGEGGVPLPDPAVSPSAAPEAPAPPSAAPASPTPAAPAQPTPTAEAVPAGPGPETVAMVAAGGVLAAGVLVLVLVAFLGRRRPTG